MICESTYITLLVEKEEAIFALAKKFQCLGNICGYVWYIAELIWIIVITELIAGGRLHASRYASGRPIAQNLATTAPSISVTTINATKW